MKDKRGFTLTELTLSIALMIVLIMLVVPNLSNMDSSTKDNLYNSKIKLALSGAYKYGKDNIDSLSNTCTEITIGELIKLEYVTGDDESGLFLLNPEGGNLNDKIICVFYADGKVKAEVKK